jgi:hypothetical protein
MLIHRSILYLNLFLVFALGACNQADQVNQTTTNASGSISLQFSHVVGNSAFTNESNLVTTKGDTLIIDELAYYISNVTFIKSNGEEVRVPDSYHLIRQTGKFGQTTRLKVDFNAIPQGSYRKIRFSVGVDSSRNFNVAQVGDLDPNGLMTWPWNIGYKYFVVEGNQIDADDGVRRALVFHIGRLPNYRVMTFDLDYEVKAGINTPLYTVLDLDKVLYSPNELDLRVTNNVMESPKDELIAQNYATAFKVSTVINNP